MRSISAWSTIPTPKACARLADAGRERLALPGREPLRVVEPVAGKARAEDDRRRDHRAAQRSAPHLVDAGDDRVARGASLLLEAQGADELDSAVHGPSLAPPRRPYHRASRSSPPARARARALFLVKPYASWACASTRFSFMREALPLRSRRK